MNCLLRANNMRKLGVLPSHSGHMRIRRGQLVGIITEDKSAWITTESGKVIRTEDQPQFP